MNQALFLSLGYVMSLSVGSYALLQFVVDKEARTSASKRALMIIVLAWIVSGLYFFVYDVMYPPRPVPLFAAYTLLFVLLVTPFFFNYVSHIMRGHSLSRSEWFYVFIPFAAGVLGELILRALGRTLSPVYTPKDFFLQLPTLPAVIALLTGLAAVGMQAFLAVWTHRLYARFRLDIGEDFSYTVNISLQGLIRLVYMYTLVLTAICFCFMSLSDPFDYAVVHIVATPFYAVFLAYACKQRDVYSAGLRPHSELIEQQQAPAMSADRFVLYKQKLKQLMEEDSLWKDPGLSAEKLAMQVGTNRSYLSQIVSEVYGRPFRTVVNNYRVDCVKGLLIDEPDLRLNEIAQNAGFASASSLNHVFKQWTGFNPSDYKAAVRNAKNQNRI